MAADLPVEESEHAALPSMPDEIWRKIAGFATPSPTSRALVVAAGADASRRTALRVEIENSELEAYGMTRDEATHGIVEVLKLIDAEAKRTEVSAVFFHYIVDWDERFWNSPVKAKDLTMQVLRGFLVYGVDPDYHKDCVLDEHGRGKTALMLTPMLVRGFGAGHAVDLARLLLDKAGADPHAESHDGLTAVAYGFEELRRIMNELDDPEPYHTRDNFNSTGATILCKLISLFIHGMDNYELLEQEPAFTRAFGGTFMDVTTLYLDLFESHPDARGKDESFSKIISALHAGMEAAGGKTTKAPRTRSPSPARSE